MAGGRNAPAGARSVEDGRFIRALHPDRKARGYSQKASANAMSLCCHGRARPDHPDQRRSAFLSGITGTSPVMTSCGQASAPVFFAAPGTPSRHFLLPAKSRGDGAPSGAPVFRLAAFPFGERGRLSALHRGDFCPRVRVSRSTSLLSRGLRHAGSSSERAPGRKRPETTLSSELPRGGVIVPPIRVRDLPSAWLRTTPAGAASDPTSMTPHDSALGGPDATIVIARRRAGISSHAIVIIVLTTSHRPGVNRKALRTG